MSLTVKVYGPAGDPAGNEQKTIKVSVRDDRFVQADKRYKQMKPNLIVVTAAAGDANPRHALNISAATQPGIRITVLEELASGNTLYIWFVAWGKKRSGLATDDLTVTVETVDVTAVSGSANAVTFDDAP